MIAQLITCILGAAVITSLVSWLAELLASALERLFNPFNLR